jgi:hypothetical protein
VLLVFLDGVGIGHDHPARNPFLSADLPALRELLGGRIPTLDQPRVDVEPRARGGTSAHAFALDATLDMDGTPQSGTGQTALLTGIDVRSTYGQHFGPWVPVDLRPHVERRSVLKRVVDAGLTACFANAYPKGWPGPRGGRRLAGPPLAARGAGLLDRHEEALEAGDAVSSEIVNDGWRRHLAHTSLPDLTPQGAGRNLARLAELHDLTLYAHYSTDTAGHRRDLTSALVALERVDRFLAGVLESISDDTLLLVVSDHGNIEDLDAGHTRNPALGVARGVGAAEAAGMADLRSVSPFILTALGVEDIA